MSGLGPDPGEAMDRWGDYTPGPWPYVGLGLIESGGRGVPRAGGEPVAYHVTDADARLISKAWLLPRLEAALREAWEPFASPQDTERARTEARALLAELAKP